MNEGVKLSSQAISNRMNVLAQTSQHLSQFEQSLYIPMRDRPGMLDFTFGNPHELPLPELVDELHRQLEPEHANWFAYTMNDPAARESVANMLWEWREIRFQPADIALTTGAFSALAVALKAVTDPSDEVIINTPPWFFYELLSVEAGLVPVKVQQDLESLELDLDAIEAAISPLTRMIIVNTPCNPTGKIYSSAPLLRLADILETASARNGRTIYILSDEPYSRIVFDNKQFVSPTALYPNTLLSYSYGKALLAPGQRIGFLALPPTMPHRDEIRRNIFLAQLGNGYAFPNSIMQYALGKLGELSVDVSHLQHKRDWLVRALREMGYSVHVPEGTFYLLVKSPLEDDVEFARLLAQENILVLPGTIAEIPGYFRISLTATDEMIERSLPGFANAIARTRQAMLVA